MGRILVYFSKKIGRDGCNDDVIEILIMDAEDLFWVGIWRSGWI